MRSYRLQMVGLLAGFLAAAAPALAQDTKPAAKKASIMRAVPETSMQRSALTGNESRIGVMNYVNTDCTSGPMPDVRIVSPPSNGELRLEQVKYAVSRNKDDIRFHCNGKMVDAMGIFYKSKNDYTGREKIVLDVDFKDGHVKRYVYSIDVR